MSGGAWALFAAFILAAYALSAVLVEMSRRQTGTPRRANARRTR